MMAALVGHKLALPEQTMHQSRQCSTDPSCPLQSRCDQHPRNHLLHPCLQNAKRCISHRNYTRFGSWSALMHDQLNSTNAFSFVNIIPLVLAPKSPEVVRLQTPPYKWFARGGWD